MKYTALLCFIMFLIFSCTNGPTPSNRERTPDSTKADNALVDRFRKDLALTDKNIPEAEIERQTKKFSLDMEYASTHEYPSNHSECIGIAKSWPNYDCTLVVGSETKPKWFSKCRATGGHVIPPAAPSGTPLIYDSELCTKTFSVRGYRRTFQWPKGSHL